jgi:hypothetical protein
VIYRMLVERGVSTAELCAAIDAVCPWVLLAPGDTGDKSRCKYLLREVVLAGGCNEPGRGM